MRYQVDLEAQSPLVITRNRAAGNQLETLTYVPGVTWRGALAGAFIQQNSLAENAHLNPSFQTLFLQEKVRFGDLRRDGETLFPLSSRVCADKDTHPVRDLLLLRECGRTLPRECGEPVPGGVCAAKLEPLEGLVRVERRGYQRKEPTQRITAHTAVSNTTLRVRDEQFYSSLAVERRTRFQGEVWASDGDAASLFEALCSQNAWFALGRGKTRGQGHVTLQMQAAPPDSEAIHADLLGLNAPFAGTDRTLFTVTLRSPCVVYDEWGLARPYITAADIVEAAFMPSDSLSGYKLVDWYSRLITIGGWNARAGLPKTDVVAIAPGSAFLFRGHVAESGRESELRRLSALLAAASAGIGERWAEGYGEARFCDPAHHQEVAR